MKKMGLIGFGRFGQVLFHQLHKILEISIYDPFKSEEKSMDNLSFSTLPEVCEKPYIILAVPVSALQDVTKKIAKYLNPKSIIMDVCAVKKYPIEVMEKNLPKDIEILGSHPLFGPDSVQNSLEGHLMIITPHRISASNLTEIKTFWQKLGIKILEMSPDEQDRLMAWTLALTHFLGRGLNGLPLPETVVSTRDYQNLLQLMRKINRDTWELFHDMHRYNPYTREMRKMLLKSMSDLKAELDQLEGYPGDHFQQT
jgi:prephenate dehydrogenase